MAGYNTSEFKKGLKVQIDGDPYLMIECNFVKPGKGQALYKCKLRNLLRGTVLDRTYKSGDSIEAADIEEIQAQFLYRQMDHFVFMDNESFEQYELTADQVGDAMLGRRTRLDDAAIDSARSKPGTKVLQVERRQPPVQPHLIVLARRAGGDRRDAGRALQVLQCQADDAEAVVQQLAVGPAQAVELFQRHGRVLVGQLAVEHAQKGLECAVELALLRMRENEVETTWAGASGATHDADPLPSDPDWAGHKVYVDERTVDVHVGRLRKSLSRGREVDPIRTVRGSGYSLDETFGRE